MAPKVFELHIGYSYREYRELTIGVKTDPAGMSEDDIRDLLATRGEVFSEDEELSIDTYEGEEI
jgi:hypothetical protein